MYKFKQMTLELANEIVKWKYTGFMKSIYMTSYFDNYNEETKVMKGPGDCDGFVAVSGDKLIGLFEYYHHDDYIEIGLALSPEYIGKGLSEGFIKSGMNFGIDNFNYKGDYFKLTVELGNEAALGAYLKVGFVEISRNSEEIEMRYNLH